MIMRLLFCLVQGPTAPLIDGPSTGWQPRFGGAVHPRIEIDSDESSRCIMLWSGDLKGQVQPGEHHGAIVPDGLILESIGNKVMDWSCSTEDS
jgi:hypothetical protein